jgi:hypothetical protein
MSEEIHIDSSNFSEYFFDVRKHKPTHGQVIARFRAIAELINGDEKRFMIKTLQRADSARSVANIMTKVFNANRESSLQIPLEIAKDMLDGMTEEEVAEKPYEYTAEFYFYTMPDYVPLDDPHWEITEILDLGTYIETKHVE